jgi:aspartate aminotransferase-like enzyme
MHGLLVPYFHHIGTGHLHPPFLKIMDDIQEGLRYTFQTDSKYTLLVTGTGEDARRNAH